MRKSFGFLLGVALICALMAGFSTISAKTGVKYPNKPINIVVPWDAGGSTDVFVRTLVTGAKKYLGQPMTVLNRGGAGGTIATTEFLKAKPDGYNVIFEAIGVFSTQPKLNKVAYSLADFEPVIATTVDPLILVTNKATGITNFEQLKAYVKTKKVNFGFSGFGSLHQIGYSTVFKRMGIKENAVSYNGGGEIISALLGDHIQFASLHPVNIMSYKDSDSLVPIMTLSSDRLESLPNVPCAKELGFDFEFEVWKCFLVPKGTPKEIIDILYRGINKMMQDPKIRKALIAGGATFIKNNTPDATLAKLKKDIEVTGRSLDELGLAKK
jgi:tripartite-type tricarboxylate transporter receptor subunit TctC